MNQYDAALNELNTNIKAVSTRELVAMKSQLQTDLATPNAIPSHARATALKTKSLLTRTLMERAGDNPGQTLDVHGAPVTPPTAAQAKAGTDKQDAMAAERAKKATAANQERLKPAYEHAVKENVDLGWEQSKAEARAAKATGYSPPDSGDGDG